MWVFMFFLLRKMVSMTSQLQDFYTKKENNRREMKIATTSAWTAKYKLKSIFVEFTNQSGCTKK